MLMKPKLQVDSRNVYSPCKEGYLKGHDSKLPSSTANRTKEIAKLHGAKIAKAAAACAAKPGRVLSCLITVTIQSSIICNLECSLGESNF